MGDEWWGSPGIPWDRDKWREPVTGHAEPERPPEAVVEARRAHLTVVPPPEVVATAVDTADVRAADVSAPRQPDPRLRDTAAMVRLFGKKLREIYMENQKP